MIATKPNTVGSYHGKSLRLTSEHTKIQCAAAKIQAKQGFALCVCIAVQKTDRSGNGFGIKVLLFDTSVAKCLTQTTQGQLI